MVDNGTTQGYVRAAEDTLQIAATVHLVDDQIATKQEDFSCLLCHVDNLRDQS
jgi:hypothetical protein